ncbi:hypothetical protein [Bacteriovorax sp. Seq25_V]|uniref:hypothetical protein n=1 Tax=Bacteriovorax sp. Seq25_V TaxID=1201288 RepID=UPI00038A22D9|nr:hypothetical protein [Bacteriovorax sp. Seq25_V]EQC44864.1 hypothetical protein M900_A0155 [Bacteriovorax sp. Seq25_V]
MQRVIGLITALFSFSTMALTPKLIVATGTNGHMLPAVSFLTNVSPAINSNGDIAFNVMAAGDAGVDSAIFFMKAGADQAEFQTVLTGGVFASDVSLSNNGLLAFGTHDGGSSQGSFGFNTATKEKTEIMELKRETFAMSGVSVNENGQYILRLIEDRGERANQKRLIVIDGQETREIIADKQDGVSYLFSHHVAGDNILFKVRYGEPGALGEGQPDKLWNYSISKGRFTPVALDRDAMPSSKIISIENQYGISRNGTIAFFAKTDAGVVLYLSNNDGMKVVLTEGKEIKNFDRFSPSVNDKGQVLLRGEDFDGKKTLFFFDGNSWSSIYKQGEIVSLDQKKYELSNSRGITFIGRPGLSENGEIVFNAILKELSSGEVLEGIIKLELGK